MASLRASLFRRDSGLAAPSSAPMSESPDPIRAELFGTDRLDQHAESLARQRILAEGETGRPLSPRVRDSGASATWWTRRCRSTR